MVRAAAKTAKTKQSPAKSEAKTIVPRKHNPADNLPKDPVTGKIIKPANSGRKPGQPNHVTKDMRAAVWQAFNDLGGVDYLLKLAKTEPRTFGTMLAKLMPAEVIASITTDLASRLQAAKQKVKK